VIGDLARLPLRIEPQSAVHAHIPPFSLGWVPPASMTVRSTKTAFLGLLDLVATRHFARDVMIGIIAQVHFKESPY
jgi:hypothetical protein